MMIARALRRTFATEKEIAMRITATKNIKKITSSMKMVAASKLRSDQQRLETAKSFSKWTSTLNPPVGDFDQKLDGTVVALTSDKGLCGGVHSAVSRGVRSLVAKNPDLKVVVLGEKGRSQMRRMVGKNLDVALVEHSVPFTFELAAEIAGKVEGQVHVAYNKFKSAIAYVPTVATVEPFVYDGDNETLANYEFEPETKDTVLDGLYQYYLATQIYYGMMEAATSEQSSRMQAMENASKNAGELIDKLTLLYNRARQARITTELIEIISGASALD